MPTINQTNRIDITVEKFLQACSKTELQEIDLLLSSYLKKQPVQNVRVSYEDFFKTLKENTTPEVYEEIKRLYIGINPRNFEAFIQLMKQSFIPEAAFEAMKIIDRIYMNTALEPMEIVNLMRDFGSLENLRRISLVKKPQLITKNDDHE